MKVLEFVQRALLVTWKNMPHHEPGIRKDPINHVKSALLNFIPHNAVPSGKYRPQARHRK